VPLYSRQLLAFMAVAKTLHFGRAAQQLRVSQPPLSQQVRQFEQWVGTPLLERSTRAVRLTAAGLSLYDAMARLMDEGETAVATAQRIAAGEAGALRLGFTPTAAYRLVPAAVGRYRAAHPAIHLALTEGTSAVLLDALEHGRIDVALMRWHDEMPDADLCFDKIDSEALVVALPAGHALARRRRIPIRLLDGIDLIGFARASSQYFHTLLAELFARNAVAPKQVMESVLPTILALVEAGIGVAIVPASVRELRPTGVQYRPLDSPNTLASELYAVHHRDTLNPAVARFLEVLQAM
jgi:DNA-binding transcriptional LysR family regulator